MGRADTIAHPAYRVMRFLADGRRDDTQLRNAADACSFYESIRLGFGERAELQVRPAGAARFRTTAARTFETGIHGVCNDCDGHHCAPDRCNSRKCECAEAAP
jgi:hypothetical protein